MKTMQEQHEKRMATSMMRRSDMAEHTIEIFSAGCILCQDVLRLVHQLARSSTKVQVYDMSTGDSLVKVREYGVTRVPALVIDGELARCCEGDSIDEEMLRRLGLGSTL
jgi:glutaredoxin 3